MDKMVFLRLARLLAMANGWIAMITAAGFHRHQILADVLRISPAAAQFMFFTQQANLLAILWWTWAVLGGARGATGDTGRMIRGAAALYILLTGIVYGAILCRLYTPGGAQAYVNLTHHVITPLLFGIDWLLTEERGSYRWRWLAAWVLYPMAYLNWIIRLGGRTRFYVYPFLDMGYLGAGRMTLHCIGMLVFMAMLGAGMVLLNRKAGILLRMGSRLDRPRNHPCA